MSAPQPEKSSGIAILRAHSGLIVVGYVLTVISATELKVDIAHVVAAKLAKEGELQLGERMTPTEEEAVSIQKAIAEQEFIARAAIGPEVPA